LEARATRAPLEYGSHVLRHGLTRARATVAWIDETVAAITSDVNSAGGRTSQTIRAAGPDG
jgi:predicted regulator of Ras-like GTPase activity (Roadblock/LC7/MglB family)